jgi:hypothetical protein
MSSAPKKLLGYFRDETRDALNSPFIPAEGVLSIISREKKF